MSILRTRTMAPLLCAAAGRQRPRALSIVTGLGLALACSTSSRGGGGAGSVAGTGGGGASSSVVGAGGTTTGFAGSPNAPGIISVDETGGEAGRGNAPAGDAGVTSARTPISIDACGANNAANLAPTDVQRLEAGGPSNSMRWLYPYDGTVFPRGLKAPLLMWDVGAGAGADAVYVHVKSSLFEYKGCLLPTAAGQLQLPQDVWDQAGTRTLGAKDPFLVELSMISGGTVSGPVSEKLVIAQATLNGSIYYDTYNALSGGSIGGAILRIVPGQDATPFLRQLACTGCHSVSTNGTRLVAREILSPDDGQVYGLTPTTAPNPSPMRAGVATGFVGLSPDGSVYVSNAERSGVGARINGALPILADVDATMYETDSGNVVTGTAIPATAMMTTFSPDGTLVAFDDYAKGGGHTLSLMKYDAASRKAASYKDAFYTDNQNYLGWPFVLPDDGGIVFAAGASPDFSGDGAGILPLVTGPVSDLFVLDVGGGSATILAKAMGFQSAQDAAAGTTYLPFGMDEIHHSYYPTVSPVPAGGYIWVFFDSMRHYGNVGFARQLWGTALTLSADGRYTSDPSHPAFYLAGQQFETANHRAFTALDPCKQDGSPCTTGVDCCNGYCTNHVCGIPDKPRCSQTSEACKTSSDCCDPRERCVNGFCSTYVQ